MHKSRIALLVTSGLGILSGLMPWAHAGFLSVSGYQGPDGLIVMGMFAFPLVLASLGSRNDVPAKASSITIMVFGALLLAISVWKISELMVPMVSIGIGIFMMLLCSIALVVLSVVSIKARAGGQMPAFDLQVECSTEREEENLRRWGVALEKLFEDFSKQFLYEKIDPLLFAQIDAFCLPWLREAGIPKRVVKVNHDLDLGRLSLAVNTLDAEFQRIVLTTSPPDHMWRERRLTAPDRNLDVPGSLAFNLGIDEATGRPVVTGLVEREPNEEDE